jgi:hypothetical protein
MGEKLSSRCLGGSAPALRLLGIDRALRGLSLQDGARLGHGLQGLVLGGSGREPTDVRRGNHLGVLR